MLSNNPEVVWVTLAIYEQVRLAPRPITSENFLFELLIYKFIKDVVCMYIRSKKLILTKVPWSSGQILEVAASDISCDDPNNKIIMVDGTEQSVVVTYYRRKFLYMWTMDHMYSHQKSQYTHNAQSFYGTIWLPLTAPIRYIHLIGYYEIEFLVMTIGKPLSRNHNFLVGISRFKAKILIP